MRCNRVYVLTCSFVLAAALQAFAVKSSKVDTKLIQKNLPHFMQFCAGCSKVGLVVHKMAPADINRFLILKADPETELSAGQELRDIIGRARSSGASVPGSTMFESNGNSRLAIDNWRYPNEGSYDFEKAFREVLQGRFSFDATQVKALEHLIDQFGKKKMDMWEALRREEEIFSPMGLLQASALLGGGPSRDDASRLVARFHEKNDRRLFESWIEDERQYVEAVDEDANVPIGRVLLAHPEWIDEATDRIVETYGKARALEMLPKIVDRSYYHEPDGKYVTSLPQMYRLANQIYHRIGERGDYVPPSKFHRIIGLLARYGDEELVISPKRSVDDIRVRLLKVEEPDLDQDGKSPVLTGVDEKNELHWIVLSDVGKISANGTTIYDAKYDRSVPTVKLHR